MPQPRHDPDATTTSADPAEPRTPAPDDQNGQPGRDGAATPGDLDAPDIVGPFGEEMPVQSHDAPGDGQP